MPSVDAPIEHRDVTTTMRPLGDIHDELVRIRRLLENGDAEEEAPRRHPLRSRHNGPRRSGWSGSGSPITRPRRATKTSAARRSATRRPA